MRRSMLLLALVGTLAVLLAPGSPRDTRAEEDPYAPMGYAPSAPGTSSPAPPRAAVQSVISPDTRTRVTPTTSAPWSHIVDLEVYFTSYSAQCTGFFIGPSVVATAAHCVYDEIDGWATDIAVIPGRDGAAEPYGFDWAMNYSAPSGWIDSGSPAFDLAAVILPDATLGTLVGQFDYAAPGDVLIDVVNVAGYPGDKFDACPVDGGCTMWTADGPAIASGDFVHHSADSFGGESGGPIWVFDGVNSTVIGIHTYGVGGPCLPGSNCGTRFTQDVVDFFVALGANAPATDTTAPSADIDAPLGGATVSGTSVAIDATAWDLSGVQKVQFWAGSTYLGYDTTEPYSKTFNSTMMTNGTQTLKVRAYDNAGNPGSYVTTSVNVSNADAVPPTVAVSSPANGATVSGTNVAFNASASDAGGIQKVQFWIDSSYLGYDTTAPYGKTFNATLLADGLHTLKVRAYDNAGNPSAYVTISVNVGADTTPPTVNISAPAGGATISGASVEFTAIASDAGGMQKVQFWMDGTYLGYDTSAPYAKLLDTTGLSNGLHVLKVRAWDNAGNASGYVTIGVTVNNADSTPPTVSISAPVNGATVSGSAVALIANASDVGGMQKVQFWVDGTYLGYDTSAPYTKVIDTTTLTNGSHTLKVRAWDNAGNASGYVTMVVTVSN